MSSLDRNRNTVFLSGVSTGFVYKFFGLNYVYPGTEIVTRDSNIVGQIGQYLRGDFYLTYFPGSVWALGSAAFAEPIKDQDQKVVLSETIFKIISQDEYESNEWHQWTTYFTVARVENSEYPYENIIDHNFDFVNEEFALSTKKTFNKVRQILQVIDVDQVVVNKFDDEDDCLSKFVNIAEIVKEKFNNSYTGYTYDYLIQLHTNDYIWSDGVNTNDQIGQFDLYLYPFASSRQYYNSEGKNGLYNTTGAHYQCLVTEFYGLFFGFGNEFAPWSVIDLSITSGSDPELDILEEFYADVIIHELGHNLGLDHSFRNIQGGWNDINTGLDQDAIDNLKRGFFAKDYERPSFNNGNLFIAYSGECPGKSAIMSYNVDSAPSFNCPYNVNNLLDQDYDVFSGSSLHRDWPYNIQDMGTIFLNRGTTQNFAQINIDGSGQILYSGSNINIFNYVDDGEFVDGEITGLTVNFTGLTGLQAYLQPSLERGNGFDSGDTLFTDEMTYKIKIYNDLISSGVTIYEKNSPVTPDPSDPTGLTQNIVINVTGDTLTEVIDNIIDYSNLSTNGIRIEYLSNIYEVLEDQFLLTGSNVLLEIKDMNLQFLTTGGTVTRKGRKYNNTWTGDTKVQHVGVEIPTNSGFTSYEKKGTEFALKVWDNFFEQNVSDNRNNDFIYSLYQYRDPDSTDIRYNEIKLVITDLKNDTAVQVDTSFLYRSGYAIQDFTTYYNNDNDMGLIVLYLRFPDTVGGQQSIIRKYKIFDYKNGQISRAYIKEITINNTSFITNPATLKTVDYVGDNNVVCNFNSVSSGNYILISVGGNLDESINIDDGTSSPQITSSFGYTGGNRKYYLKSGESEFYYMWETDKGLFVKEQSNTPNPYQVYGNDLITGGGGIIFSEDFSDSIQAIYGEFGDYIAPQIVEIFTYSWPEDGSTSINLLLSNGDIIKLLGYKPSQNVFTQTGQEVVRNYNEIYVELDPRFTRNSLINTKKWIGYPENYLEMGKDEFYIKGVTSEYTYKLPKQNLSGFYLDNSGNPIIPFRVNDTITGDTYLDDYYSSDNIVLNSEKVFRVISQADFQTEKYTDYYRTYEVDLPLFSGVTNSDKVPRGNLTYEFQKVDYGTEYDIPQFTGTVKLLILVILDEYTDDYLTSSFSSRSEADYYMDYISTNVELGLNESGFDFDFEVDYKIYEPGDTLYSQILISYASFKNYINGTYGGPKGFLDGYDLICRFIDINAADTLNRGSSGQWYLRQTIGEMAMNYVTINPIKNVKNILHELGHGLGCRHSFDNVWGAIFPDTLKYDFLDPVYPFSPSFIGAVCCNMGDQELPYRDEFEGDDKRRTSIMGYSNFIIDDYNEPVNAQGLLESKKIQIDNKGNTDLFDEEGYLYTAFIRNCNVFYHEFLNDGQITTENNLSSIKVTYRTPNPDNPLNNTKNYIYLNNSGETPSVTIFEPGDTEDNEVKVFELSGSQLSNVFDIDRQSLFGVKIIRESDGGSIWAINREELKIEFILEDGTSFTKLPKDCFTITKRGTAVRNYFLATPDFLTLSTLFYQDLDDSFEGFDPTLVLEGNPYPLTKFTSFERKIINDHINYRIKNYLD